MSHSNPSGIRASQSLRTDALPTAAGFAGADAGRFYVGLQRLGGRSRWSITPETVDELFGRDDSADGRDQVCQQRALLTLGDVDRSAFTGNLKRARTANSMFER